MKAIAVGSMRPKAAGTQSTMPDWAPIRFCLGQPKLSCLGTTWANPRRWLAYETKTPSSGGCLPDVAPIGQGQALTKANSGSMVGAHAGPDRAPSRSARPGPEWAPLGLAQAANLGLPKHSPISLWLLITVCELWPQSG